MADENKNAPGFLDLLLTVSPEAALESFHMELHRHFSPFEAVLDILMNQELEEKDYAMLFEIMKRNSTGMHELLDLMRDYLKAREGMKNADDKTPE